MFGTTYGYASHGAADSTMREPRSGLSGFGGRPSLHPAWRDEDAATANTQTSTEIPALSKLRGDARPPGASIPRPGQI